MPTTTPNRGYPYPLPADPNNVPADMQALAEAIDDDLGVLDAAWTRASATVTNISGTAQMAYKKIGTVCHFVGGFTGTVTANGTTTACEVRLPFPAAAHAYTAVFGPAMYRDAGVRYFTGMIIVNSAVDLGMLVDTDGIPISSTRPWAWGSGDGGFWNMTYEVAP